MELKNIKTFLQVVESNSFTKAAESLGYTQAAVSFQIHQLEEELNCQLFDRIGRNIYLTNRGELLKEHALNIKNSLENLVDDFKEEEMPTGQVRMYSSDSICEKMILENYDEFYNTYPNIRLVFSTGSTKDLLEILERNESDAIFTLDHHIYRQNFVIAKESSVKLRFVASASSRLAHKKDIEIEELLSYPFLLTERGMSYRKILDDHLSSKSLEVKPVLETGRTDIILKYVKKGTGITFLPEFVAHDAVQEGSLVYLDVKDFDLTIWKQLIYRKDKWMAKHFKCFLDFVMEHEFDW